MSEIADLAIAGAVSPSQRPSPKPAVAISLIVCTIGRAQELTRLFHSLAAQSAGDFEVVVVDQNSEGFLAPVLKAFTGQLRLKRVRSERGLSRARNIGLAQAEGGLVCFPDDDCWYPPDAIEKVVGFFRDHRDVDLLLGRTLDQEGRESLSDYRPDSGPVSKENVWVSGNSNTLFVRRAVTDRVHFDEALGVGAATPFQSGEETDFVLTALQSGKRAFFARDCVIHHDQVDATIDARFVARVRGYSAGYGRVLRKHGYPFYYLYYRIGRALAGMLIAAVMFDRPQIKLRWVWVAGALRGYFARPPA